MAAGGGQSRLVGVGFLVGATDDGASDTFEETADSADRLADSVEQAGERGERSVGLLDRALSGLAAVNLGGIASTLDSIAERAGVGIGAQATQMESFGAQFAQTSRAALARLGSMGDALRQHQGEVSSLAFAYQISGDEMFAAMAPLSRLGVDIEDTGISLQGLAGHIQSGMVSGQAFGGVLAELIGSMEMAPEAAGGLINSLTAIGDRFGMVDTVGQQMPAMLDAIRPVAARFPMVADNVDVAMSSITRLAASMTNLGMAPENAMQAAIQTFTTLGEQRGAMEDLVTGLGSEFPELARQIGISTGDIEGSIAAVMSDPVRFAQQMGEAMRQAGEGSVMGRRLAAALGQISPELLNVVRNAAEGGDALAAAVEPIEGVEDAFNRAGRAALTSTRTFAENLDLMRDAFNTRMNQIGRATDENFVKRQRDAYRRVGNRIEELAADDGPLGMLTRKFLQVRTFGLVQGLLPSLGALTEGLGDTAAAMGSTVHVLGDMGIFRQLGPMLGRIGGWVKVIGPGFLKLAGPVGLAAGAGYLLFQHWEKLPELLESIEERLQGAGEWFRGIGERFIGWVKNIDWAAAGREAMDRLFTAITGTIEALFSGDRGQGQVGAAIWSGLVNIFTGLSTMIGGLASGLWERMTEGFQTELGGSAGMVQRFIGTIFESVQNNLRNVWTVLSTLGRLIITPIRALWNLATPGLSMMMRIFSGGRTEAEGFSGILDTVVSGIEWLVDRATLASTRMESMADAMASFFEDTVGEHIQPFLDALERDIPYLEGIFTAIFEDAKTVFADLFTAFGEVSSVVWDLWTETLEPVFSMFWDIVSQIFGGGRDSLSGQAQYTYRNVGDEARSMWADRIRPALTKMVGAFARGFRWISVNGTELFTNLAFQGQSAMVRIETAIARVRNVWQGLQNVMRAGWQAVQVHTQNIIGNMLDFVDLTFQRMLHGWDRLIMNLKIFLAQSFQGILDNINTLVSNIPDIIARNVPGIREFAAGMARASTAIGTTLTDLNSRNRDMLLEQRREEREALDRMRRRREMMTQSLRNVAEAARQTRANDAALVASSERQIENLRTFYSDLRTEVLSGTEQAYARFMDIHRRLSSGEITVEREQRAAAERLMGAGRLATALEGMTAEQRRRFGPEGIRMLQEAVGRRAVGQQRALSEQEVNNIMARMAQLSRGPQGRRGEGIRAIADLLGTGRRVGQLVEREEPVRSRRRGAGARATTEAAEGAGAPGAVGPDGSRGNPIHVAVDEDNTPPASVTVPAQSGGGAREQAGPISI